MLWGKSWSSVARTFQHSSESGLCLVRYRSPAGSSFPHNGMSNCFTVKTVLGIAELINYTTKRLLFIFTLDTLFCAHGGLSFPTAPSWSLSPLLVRRTPVEICELYNPQTKIILSLLTLHPESSQTAQVAASSDLLGWKSVRSLAAFVPVGTLQDRGSQMCHNNFLPRSCCLVAIESHVHIRQMKTGWHKLI